MKSNIIGDTNRFLSSISKKEKDIPNDYDFIFYILAKEFGISDFSKYSVPYLHRLVLTYDYVKDLEEEEYKKISRRK